MKTKRAAPVHIRPQVLKYLETHPGVHIYLEDIVKDIKAPRPMSVQRAVLQLSDKHPEIHIVTPGRVWMWRPLPTVAGPATIVPAQRKSSEQKSKRIFEELATTKSGQLLIQDSEGKVYTAEEL